LSAQNVTKPMLLDAKVRSVTARALQNDSQIAVLVEWSDESQDDRPVAVQDFRDAVALQFPLVQGQPYFCMGQQGGDVNIWHWKADWQADLNARQDMDSTYPDMYVDEYTFADPAKGVSAGVGDYSDPNYVTALAAGNLFASPVHLSPVEDLIAGGFGSLTAQAAEAQNVQGFGSWADGKWQVIFTRDLQSPEAEDITFAPGKAYSLAFAVWDGSNEERNGQKSTSQWVTLQLRAGPPAAPAAETQAQAGPFWRSTQFISITIFAVLAVFLLLIGLVYWRLPE
jgi:cytochrome b558/566 subunit A